MFSMFSNVVIRGSKFALDGYLDGISLKLSIVTHSKIGVFRLTK